MQPSSKSKEYWLIALGAMVGLALYYAIPDYRAVAIYAASIVLLGSVVLLLPFVPFVRKLMDAIPPGQRDTRGLWRATAQRSLAVRFSAGWVAMLLLLVQAAAGVGLGIAVAYWLSRT